MAKLVAIGDSLTQGFQSAAICHVDQSYPAIIARCMGLDVDTFRIPDFTGAGGLPCNLEWVARRIHSTIGPHVHSFEWPAAVVDIAFFLDQVEDYWEKGRGNMPGANELFHNLAIWGFEAGDAYAIRALAAYNLANQSTKPAWFHPPSEARMRTAWRVLNPALDPSRTEDTQIEVAKRIEATEGGIENLIVFLGANNCLGTVLHLDVNPTKNTPPGPFSDYTLWTPEAFSIEYAELAKQIASIKAQNVFVATIPHVTIPPVTRGIMADRSTKLPKGRTYFDYYARVFVDPASFDPEREPCLTLAKAKLIDDTIDHYNEQIRKHAKNNGWHVVDIFELMEALAVKRNGGVPKYVLPPALEGLDVQFIEFDKRGALVKGGLIALDGVHPTTCGYSLIAREFIRVMNKDRGTKIPEPNYAEIRASDTLVSHAPPTLFDVERLIEVVERRFHCSRWFKSRTKS